MKKFDNFYAVDTYCETYLILTIQRIMNFQFNGVLLRISLLWSLCLSIIYWTLILFIIRYQFERDVDASKEFFSFSCKTIILREKCRFSADHQSQTTLITINR